MNSTPVKKPEKDSTLEYKCPATKNLFSFQVDINKNSLNLKVKEGFNWINRWVVQDL